MPDCDDHSTPGGSGVAPQVVLGDYITGYGSDNLRQALNKYNNHEHAFIRPADLIALGVRPNQSVQVAENSKDAFPQPLTVVETVGAGFFTTTLPALRDVLNEPLIVGGEVIPACTVSEGDQMVTVGSRYGFLPSEYLDRINNGVFNLFQVPIENGPHHILLSPPAPFYLSSISLLCPKGQADVELVLGSLRISLAIALTDLTQTVNLLPHSIVQAPIVNPGEDVRLLISNAHVDTTLTLTGYYRWLLPLLP